MADDFYELVVKSQAGDKEATLEIVTRFGPLIKKYSYLLRYDGANSDLVIALIEIVKKIPIYRDNNLKYDKFLIGYVSSALKNRYIQLSKKYSSIYSMETELNLSIAKGDLSSKLEDRVFIGEVLDKLSGIQKKVIVMKFIKNYSDKDISNILKISRQSVNRAKNRGLKNIRKYINGYL